MSWPKSWHWLWAPHEHDEPACAHVCDRRDLESRLDTLRRRVLALETEALSPLPEDEAPSPPDNEGAA